MTREKIKRGPLVAVSRRIYTDPIPDELVQVAETAGLTLDDEDHHVIAYRDGKKCGTVWGPSVEGEWFAYRDGSAAVRVPTRDDALRHMLGLDAEAVDADV
jgi:hypothetical protein